MRKKIFRYIFIGFISFLLTGCVSQYIPLPPKSVLTNINLGDTLQVNVGESLITKGTFFTYPGFIALDDFSYHRHGIDAVIAKGKSYICTGKLESGELICRDYHYGQMQIPDFYMPTLSVIDKNGVLAGFVQGAGFTPLDQTETVSFIPKEITDILEENFKQELIYSGKSKDILKLLYREFIRDMARPSFSIDLTYDLSESKVIGFRDIKINVMEATNTGIKYKVIEREGKKAE